MGSITGNPFFIYSNLLKNSSIDKGKKFLKSMYVFWNIINYFNWIHSIKNTNPPPFFWKGISKINRIKKKRKKNLIIFLDFELDLATWPSGKAGDCKSFIPSSNLGVAFSTRYLKFLFLYSTNKIWQIFVLYN